MNFEQIKRIREELDLTQKEIANMLNVTRSAYSLWEIGKNVIPLKKLNDFCNHFKLSLDYVVGLSDKNRKNLNYVEINPKELGKRIKLARKELNLTQEKIAEKFNTTHSAISAYENGVTLIPTLFLIELSKISNVSLDFFCGKCDIK